MIDLRNKLRQIGLGTFLYRYLFRPIELVSLANAYGWGLTFRARYGNARMHSNSRRLSLPRTPSPATAQLPVCFLTGRRFIHQTLFCAHSFAVQNAESVSFEFFSDGTLGEVETKLLVRLFPSALIRSSQELDRAVAAALPPEKFPVLHAVRKRFVLLRKLTDAMAGQSGYRLFFDSDMLFWHNPRELLAAMMRREAVYLRDTTENGYTVSSADLHRTFNVPVAPDVNSGLVGLDASQIDWPLLERVCDFLEKASGDQRLLEQTLWAVALGAQSATPLDADRYRVLAVPNDLSSALRQTPALLHYAWHARLPYTESEWRRYLAIKR